ncbi:MAG: hypothetical protein ABEK12_00910, partial [Candidatus Nanohaloarchaea archaeon]
MSTLETGYADRRTDLLREALRTVAAPGATTLDDVYRELHDGDGYPRHYVWTGIRELEAGGVISGLDSGGRTYLRVEDTDVGLDDLPGYDAAETVDGETGRVNQKITVPWTDSVAGEDVPALRRGILADFLDRHDWDRTLFEDGRQVGVTGYRSTASGDKEYRITAVNDYGSEEDLLRVRVAFHDDTDIFQQRHRESYGQSFWGPLATLQQRNMWINRS